MNCTIERSIKYIKTWSFIELYFEELS